MGFIPARCRRSLTESFSVMAPGPRPQPFVGDLPHLSAFPAKSLCMAVNKWQTHKARMSQKGQGTTGWIHLKWFGQNEVHLTTLSGYFQEYSSQINNFLLHKQLCSQRKWHSKILGWPFASSDKISTLENEVCSIFCPTRAGCRGRDAISLMYSENESPAWTESIHFHSE